MTDGPYYFVMDVESVGLHGPAYAVGVVVVNDAGLELYACKYFCDYEYLSGTRADFKWLEDNAPRDLYHTHIGRAACHDIRPCDSPLSVRQHFWADWTHWRDQGAILVADCPWPVEAKFLLECVADNSLQRNYEGPYPLLDVATVRFSAGLDPLGTDERLPSERPVHDPLADARQSARLFLGALHHIAQARAIASGVDY